MNIIQKQNQLNVPIAYLDFLFNPRFKGVNRLSVLPFHAFDNRTGRSRYYLPTAKVEEYNVIIDEKGCFDQAVKMI